MKPTTHFFVTAILATLAVSQATAGPIYLFVQNIDGNVEAPGFVDWIDVSQLAIGDFRESVSGGTRRGDAQFTTLQVTTTGVNMASPLLWEAVASGEFFPTAEIAVLEEFKGVDKPIVELEFKNAQVVNYQLFTDDVGELVDKVELGYEEMTFRHNSYDESGNPQGSVEATWKLEEGVSSPTFSFAASESPSGPQFAADFNRDGSVDVLDLQKWQGDFGVNGESDANGDGRSGGADMLVWQRQYGSGSPPVASQPVPEPATAALLAGGVLASLLYFHSSRVITSFRYE